MHSSLATYRTPDGSVYVELPSGAFLVVARDGGSTEERLALPASAQLLVARGDR